MHTGSNAVPPASCRKFHIAATASKRLQNTEFRPVAQAPIFTRKHDRLLAETWSEAMSEVFISYARKDEPFAHRLHAALEKLGRTAWIDLEGIAPSSEWLHEIYSAIEAADAIVYVISASSVDSTICSEEIIHAVKNNKRIIPVVWQSVDDTALPKAVRDRNWIFFRETDDFDAALGLLIKALDTDLDWVRGHTRLLTRAIEWEQNAKDSSYSLRGNDLKRAEFCKSGSTRTSINSASDRIHSCQPPSSQ